MPLRKSPEPFKSSSGRSYGTAPCSQIFTYIFWGKRDFFARACRTVSARRRKRFRYWRISRSTPTPMWHAISWRTCSGRTTGEDGAKANLRRHLHRLQQALPTAGVPLLLTGAGRVRLNPAANIWYDVTEYQRALDGSGTLE